MNELQRHRALGARYVVATCMPVGASAVILVMTDKLFVLRDVFEMDIISLAFRQAFNILVMVLIFVAACSNAMAVYHGRRVQKLVGAGLDSAGIERLTQILNEAVPLLSSLSSSVSENQAALETITGQIGEAREIARMESGQAEAVGNYITKGSGRWAWIGITASALVAIVITIIERMFFF